MNLSKVIANIVLIGTLTACSWSHNNVPQTPAQLLYHQQSTEIFLQDPLTRIVARCYASAPDAANACAETFKSKGYVRLQNIPYKTARYDFLIGDTFPSRRWRNNELTPRW